MAASINPKETRGRHDIGKFHKNFVSKEYFAYRARAIFGGYVILVLVGKALAKFR